MHLTGRGAEGARSTGAGGGVWAVSLTATAGGAGFRGETGAFPDTPVWGLKGRSSMLRSFAAAVLAALGLAGCGSRGEWRPPAMSVPVPAAMIDASDAAAIAEIARRYGSADWARDGVRDPLIRADAAGSPYRIEFYGCADGRDCSDLRFVARLPVRDGAVGQSTAGRLDDWNRTRRFGKVWFDTDGTAVLEMNVTLSGGVSRQNLDTVFDWWVFALQDFARGTTS